MADHFDFSDYPKNHEVIKSLPENQWITTNGKRVLKNKKSPRCIDPNEDPMNPNYCGC